MKVYCYRYMWTLKQSDGDNKKVNFKIITDTAEGLALFEKQFVDSVKDVENFGKEYICEYDVSLLGVFTMVSSASKGGDCDETVSS